jgi:parvulin-like peptidyl-prolyl isomerase
VLALLAVLLVPAAEQPVVVDRIAAVVDGVAIPETAVRRAMATSALQPEPGEKPEAFRARVLDALIDQRLEYEDAVRFGPAPPDAAEVSAAVQKLRARLKAEGKDPDAEFAAAGLSPEEVRGMVERQLIVERHLAERFRPLTVADEQGAREEYEKLYAPERRAANLPVPSFDAVADEMRLRAQQRAFAREVEKWLKELRQKARIEIFGLMPPYPEGATPVILSK